MTRQLIFTSLLAACLAGSAFATPALDAAGKCRDNGKFVAAKLCTATATTGKCRDIQTKKFAKCGTPGTEPVPKSSAPPK
jgi:hypothetical protein